jgi:hypothetical protein
MEDRLKSLLTLVPWTLQRLLNNEFEVEWDANGVPKALDMDPRYGRVSTEEMEESLKGTRDWVGLEALSASRDHLTPERISEALEKEPLGLLLHLGYLRREDLLHADWPEIVASAYWGSRRFYKDLLLGTIDSRIGLARRIPIRTGLTSIAEFEAAMQLLHPDALPRAVAEYVIGEMSESFLGIVERLSTFQVTAVTDAVPAAVKQYAREACRCYLHGFFSASLILCRSCIESAIETKLDQKGLRKELDRLPFNKVQELLRLAVNSGVLDDLTRHLADEIRRSANKAVHGSAPSEAECRERLEQTRAVLRHIYE